LAKSILTDMNRMSEVLEANGMQPKELAEKRGKSDNIVHGDVHDRQQRLEILFERRYA
jgi:hypothetical protein